MEEYKDSSSLDEQQQTQEGPEFNAFLKGIFIFFIISSLIGSARKLFVGLMLEEYVVSLVSFIMELLGCAMMVVVLTKKKGWAMLVVFGLLLIQIPVNALLHAPNLSDIAMNVFIRMGILAGLLFLRKDGISGWKTLFPNMDWSRFTEQQEVNREQEVSEFSQQELVDASEPQKEIRSQAAEAVIMTEPKPEPEPIQKDPFVEEPVPEFHQGISASNYQEPAPVDESQEPMKVTATTKPCKKIGKTLVVATIGCLLLSVLVFLVIKVKNYEYPEAVKGFSHKFKYRFDLPDNSLAHSLLASAKEYEQKGLTTLAEDCYDSVGDLTVTDAVTCVEMGDHYFSIAKYKKACRYYKRALDEKKPQSVLFYKIALSCYRDACSNSIEVPILERQQLNPTNDEVFKHRIKQLKTALFNAEMALSLEDSKQNVLLLFSVNHMLQDKDEARKWIKRFHELYPGSTLGKYMAEYPWDVYRADPSAFTADDDFRLLQDITGVPIVTVFLKVKNYGGGSDKKENELKAKEARYIGLTAESYPLATGTFSFDFRLFEGNKDRFIKQQSGYSFSYALLISNIYVQQLEFEGFGWKDKGHFNPGQYRYEIWYNENLVDYFEFSL